MTTGICWHENAHERFAYYSRVVRTGQLHDYHYPDDLGPSNKSQPCAQLLKGTLNMWYCGNCYPRDLVWIPVASPTIFQNEMGDP